VIVGDYLLVGAVVIVGSHCCS